MRLVQGRDFVPEDRTTGSPVIVNETIARRNWPGKSPVGECAIVGRDEGCSTVIGVVADSRRFQLVETEPPRYYYQPLPLPGEPLFAPTRVLLVRRKPNAPRVEAAIVQALRAVDPNVPFARIETLGEALDPQIRPWRLGASVFTAFGILATILAMIGLWSSVAYAVSQRTREFAIRKAVGAGDGSLIALMLKGGLRRATIAVAIGTVAAWLASPLLADLLFQVNARDAAVFAAVAAGVLLVAVAASVAPSWKATRVHPAAILRHE
jgi:ABC-type antimicrobial peptide transport system permease subunit